MHHLYSAPEETKSPGSRQQYWLVFWVSYFFSISLPVLRDVMQLHLWWPAYLFLPSMTLLCALCALCELHPKWPESLLSNSYDGVPFLMHDSTLSRTTNIKEVYPNDTAQNAALFSWDALKELNAGAWFLKVSIIKDHHQLVVEEEPAGYYLLGWILGGKFLVEPEQSQQRSLSYRVFLFCTVGF